jgi:predicted anti-sigma-YlaC factor YlaD
MLSCREVTQLVSEAHERPLGVHRRELLRMHLTMCSACRRFDDQMTTIRAAMRALAEKRAFGSARGHGS